MLRGTRILLGKDAEQLRAVEIALRTVCGSKGYEQIVFPNISELEIFTSKADEKTMYTFKDKGDRDVCLNPEITALVQREYNESWAKSKPKPVRVMYCQKCYRYDRPQAGRYREFVQFGIELLGGKSPQDKEEVISILEQCLSQFKGTNQFLSSSFKFVDKVKRGLGYYVEDGFEVEVEALGAQKQVAGGGRYAEGIGWAIGLERLILSQETL